MLLVSISREAWVSALCVIAKLQMIKNAGRLYGAQHAEPCGDIDLGQHWIRQ